MSNIVPGLQIKRPFGIFLIPDRFDQFRVENDILSQVIFLRRIDHILLDFLATGVEFRPNRIGLEGEYIAICFVESV